MEIWVIGTSNQLFRRGSKPFSAWCPLKGDTYLNKPAAFSFSLFKYV